MNWVSALLMLSFLVYLYLGITTYRLNKESRVNSQMLIVCLNFALWSFAYAFMHISEDRDIAFLWYRLSTIGWLFFLPFIVHLLVLMSGNARYLTRAFFLVIYGTPSAALVWVNGFLIDPSLLYRVPGGWTTVYDIGIVWIILYLSAYYLILGTSWYTLYRWGKKSKYKREQKQVRIFLFTSIISLTLASVFDNILPFAGILRFPLVAPFITLIWMFGLWYAIHRFGMMKIDTSLAASEFIDSMNELLFMSDRDGIIRHTNAHSCRILGMDRAEIINKTVGSLVRSEESIGEVMRRIGESDEKDTSIDVDFMSRDGVDIPVRLSVSVVRDREGDTLAIVFVGFDLRETNELKKMQRIMEFEIEMAAQVQARLFNHTTPRDPSWDIDIVYRPLARVSGDFYDFYEFDNTLKGLSLFDVSGHGVSAGLITMITRSMVFRRFRSMVDRPLEEVLSAINEELIREIGRLDDYMTGILLRFKDGFVEYVNAAHPHIIQRHADGSMSVLDNILYDNRGPFLGMYDVVLKYKVQKFAIHPGDELLIYTDALTECLGGSKRRFGVDRLVSTFKSAPNGSAREILSHIVGEAERFTEGRGFVDDLTAILLRRL